MVCTRFCQSCAMPMPEDSVLGANADGSLNEDYCKYCYDNGGFVKDVTMEEFIKICSQFGEQAGMTKEQMADHCRKIFPSLKRWNLHNQDV